ncbi:MAG TPA: Hpt domain-containing protein, partial [Isosphaeraceae bacterium]|nr:Hpt domain-containing protein [Isosphaeraceae bacterium]
MTAWAEATNPLDRLAGRLEALRGQVDARAAEPEAGFDGGGGAVRSEFETLRTEAEQKNQPAWAEALHRLGVLSEVWECLAAEEPASANAVADFSRRALDHMIQATQAAQEDADLAWITRDSSTQWGTYLDLLSGTGQGSGFDLEPFETQPSYEEADEPAPDEKSSNIDLGALLSLFSGTPSSEARAASAEQRDETTLHSHGAGHGPELTKRDNQRISPPSEPETAIYVSPFSRPPTQSTDLDPEMREAFLADLSDLFERIQTVVLEDLERPERKAEALLELGRCFHTLKGAAGSVGLSDLAGRVHDLEDRLEQAAAEAAPVPIDLLHEAIGYLESFMYNLQQNRRPAAPEPSIASSAAAGQELPTPLPAPLSTSELDAEGALAGGPSDGSIRISCERIDEMMDLVSELITRRILWAAQAETIKEFASTAQIARNRLMGSIDRLRGLLPARDAALESAASELEASGLIHRLAEQSDDLAALAETARAAAEPLADDADVLARVSLQLWDALQAVRVLPVRGLFHRLARVAREASRIEGRPIEVVLVGEDAGLDRSVQDRAFEPLLHVVRNAVGHGIEPVEERLRAGKPPRGRITIEARREGYTMLLKVQDDGRGLDYAAIAAQGHRLGLLEPDVEPTQERLNALIFQSGFSTRAQ